MNAEFMHRRQALHRARLQCHEVAEADGAPGHQFEQQFVDDVEGLELQRLDAAFALRHHHVDVGAGERRQQVRDGIGQILAVRIHHHAGRLGQVFGDVVDAHGDRPLMPDIALEPHHHAPQARIGDGRCLDRLADRAVVDGDDEEVWAERAAQLLEQPARGFPVLIYRRHDDTFDRRFGHDSRARK